MKTKIEVNYLNHNIKVLYKWNEIALIINNVICATYNAAIAFPFILRGVIEHEHGQSEILLEMKLRPIGGMLFLTANGHLLAKKWIL